jgi:acetyl-CoA carboxylase biotin carboxyl carrier protein
VLSLVAELPGLPERIRISFQDVMLELEWPAAAQQAMPDDPAASTAHASATFASTVPGSRASRARSSGEHAVTAATVGTFYHAPTPGAPPFVAVGDVVRPGQQIAIVEAMKLMIPVESDVAGWVREVLKADGQPVEFGEPLFLIERS